MQCGCINFKFKRLFPQVVSGSATLKFDFPICSVFWKCPLVLFPSRTTEEREIN